MNPGAPPRSNGGVFTLHFLAKLKGLVPLFLRATLGYSFFLVHGLDKVRPGGKWDFGEAFAQQGAQLAPTALLYVAAWTEFLAGLGILVGLLTRWACVGICCVMGYAIFKVHWSAGYAAPAGYEMALSYATAALALMIVGPGSLSLDRMFFGRKVLGA